jgi:hypothetical protein
VFNVNHWRSPCSPSMLWRTSWGTGESGAPAGLHKGVVISTSAPLWTPACRVQCMQPAAVGCGGRRKRVALRRHSIAVSASTLKPTYSSLLEWHSLPHCSGFTHTTSCACHGDPAGRFTGTTIRTGKALHGPTDGRPPSCRASFRSPSLQPSTHHLIPPSSGCRLVPLRLTGRGPSGLVLVVPILCSVVALFYV